MKSPSANSPQTLPSVRLLRPRDIEYIENALRNVGPFGEVHLVVERGRIRFVRTIKSEAVDEPRPSSSNADA